MKEEFKEVKGFEGLYEVSNHGNIYSLKFNKRRKLSLNTASSGYINLGLTKDKVKYNKLLHRIVISSFYGESNLEVNHKDGDKINNKLENLEWCTRSENLKHKYRVLNYKNPSKGKLGKYSMGRKSVNQYKLNGEFIKTWESIIDVTRELQINNVSISLCCKGKYKTSGGFIWRYTKEV